MKTSLKVTLLIFFVFNITNTFGQKSCEIELKVENDRNSRSTPLDGTYYPMNITNNGTNLDTYSLSYIDANKTSVNPNGSSTEKNVILDIEFLDKNLKAITTIKVNPKESAAFFAHVIVPKGTLIEKWSCTKVIAKSKLCSNYNEGTTLYTFVINPNEDK